MPPGARGARGRQLPPGGLGQQFSLPAAGGGEDRGGAGRLRHAGRHAQDGRRVGPGRPQRLRHPGRRLKPHRRHRLRCLRPGDPGAALRHGACDRPALRRLGQRRHACRAGGRLHGLQHEHPHRRGRGEPRSRGPGAHRLRPGAQDRRARGARAGDPPQRRGLLRRLLAAEILRAEPENGRGRQSDGQDRGHPARPGLHRDLFVHTGGSPGLYAYIKPVLGLEAVAE